MAFTLVINSKGLFGKVKSIQMAELLKNCGLKYGSNNEFYILEDDKMNQNTAVLYNAKRTGRGIFFDGSRIADGQVTISYNIPTTKTEIHDFIQVAREIERQFKKASIYCTEEKRNYTMDELENKEEAMAAFSLESLHHFCNDQEMKQCILTLALYPWFMEPEKREYYKTCPDLDDFEETIHELQAGDFYYAKPSLMKNKNDGKVLAVYTLTDECASIFPMDAKAFLNLDGIQVDEGLISFWIYGEQRRVEGLYPYDKFVEYMMNHGAAKFDASHMRIPGNITKEEIDKMIAGIGQE